MAFVLCTCLGVMMGYSIGAKIAKEFFTCIISQHPLLSDILDGNSSACHFSLFSLLPESSVLGITWKLRIY
jgi:hypothetical protein